MSKLIEASKILEHTDNKCNNIENVGESEDPEVYTIKDMNWNVMKVKCTHNIRYLEDMDHYCREWV